MQLNADDLNYLGECAISAARQAGKIIASYTNKAVSVQHKQSGNSIASQVVTEVDLLSEAAIVKLLKPTCERFDIALLTEESVDNKARLDKDFFWCIDPLDGTLSFIESTPGYSVSIALVSQSGVPFIGVVYDPVSHTLYSAVKQQGAFRNGTPYDISSNKKIISSMPLTLVFDRGFIEKYCNTQFNNELQAIASKSKFAGVQLTEKHGAVMNACWVLDNPPAIYFKLPKPKEGGGSVWDFAATAALFNELKLVASDFYGQPLDLNRADSTFMNHRGVIFATEQSLAVAIQSLLKFDL